MNNNLIQTKTKKKLNSNSKNNGHTERNCHYFQQYGSNTVQILIKYGSNTDQIRIKYDQIMIKYGSNTDQIRFKY